MHLQLFDFILKPQISVEARTEKKPVKITVPLILE